MLDVAIVSATRTAIGNFLGGLSTVTATDLGVSVIKNALAKISLNAIDIDEVILGQVLVAGSGQNPARQSAIRAGCRQESTAITINQVCGSGLRAVAMGVQAIKNGDAKIIVAGGQENMSLAMHASYHRSGTKMGDIKLLDTMIQDGLWDAFNNYHMGVTAENIAEKFKISREDQDKFAVASQNKASNAQQQGYFKDEITPITIKNRKGDTIIDQDEFIRHDASFEGLSKLRPAFNENGTITAGNASGLNDGAAVVVLMSVDEAKKRNLKPLAIIKSWASVGVDPKIMGTGPVPASKLALEKAGWTINDLDLIEANEAFAAQAICVNQEMGWDINKVNVNGGAIAIGHPIGASGCRVLVTLLYEMRRRKVQKGLATLCIGGGMGIALTVECDA
jgi:acetyl-CoA C-acetyltransferase